MTLPRELRAFICVIRGHDLWEDEVHTYLKTVKVVYCYRCPHFEFIEE